MPKTLRLILGDQLNANHSWLKKVDDNVTYLMLEMMQEQEYVMHHIQKILGFFAAMRNFAHQLVKAGHQVIYLKLDNADNERDLSGTVKYLIAKHQFTRFEYQLPDEYRLDQQLSSLCDELDIETGVADTEHFLNERYAVKDFFGGRKSYLMENFYRHSRSRLGILMQSNGKPEGGAWNFDHENRSKYDGKVPLAAPLTFKHDVWALKKMVDAKKVKYFGHVDEKNFNWPLSRAEALKLLDYFCDNLLQHFGTYEDAMLQQHYSLYHSRISFAQNTKMISPAEIIAKVLDKYHQNKHLITLPQVEGYIRQIIGWREFMRGVYWAQMPAYADLNFFGHDKSLPSWYWTGQVKMNCMNKCINQSLDKAWAHHIQRLMVIGNFSLLAGFHPDEVDAWYLGVYIDAIQWVEITNTRGMSQYADAGIIASKPYVASAAYINKMSDYCKNCHYNYKEKYGDNACPFNSLYWNFFDRHADKLKDNPRIGVMYKTWQRFGTDEREKILEQAERYLANLEQL